MKRFGVRANEVMVAISNYVFGMQEYGKLNEMKMVTE